MTRAFKATAFASIPYELMDVMTERSGKQIVCVYLWLHRFGWGSEQGCWASIATIAKSTGIKPDHVRQAIQWLLAEGWVVQTPRPGRTSVYFVRMHRDAAPLPQKGVPPEGGSTPPLKGGNTPPPKGGTNKNPRTKTQKQKPISKRDASAASKDPNRLKKLNSAVIPTDLSDCSDLLVEYWAVKGGVRSTSVLNRLCKTLRAMTPQQRQEALERACSGGWANIYPPKPQAGYSAAQGPAAKHPAHRVFTADHGFTDQPATNPVLNGLF
jgi:hypothetical protein